jgi:hypothetical protein
MGYVLEALLVRRYAGWSEELQRRAGPAVALYEDREGSLVLIPILDPDIRSSGELDTRGIEDPIVPGFLKLRQSVAEFCTEASRFGRLTYVHAEFFGGTGVQAAIGWQDGAVEFGPDFTASTAVEAVDAKIDTGGDYLVIPPPADLAIEHALEFLLAETAPSAVDLFDTVGLGRHRWTNDWLDDEGRLDPPPSPP